MLPVLYVVTSSVTLMPVLLLLRYGPVVILYLTMQAWQVGTSCYPPFSAQMRAKLREARSKQKSEAPGSKRPAC